MSIDRPGDPSGSAGSSSEPAKAQDDDKPNWKPVYAAIAIAVALTLATVLWINRPGTESADPPPSPATAPSVASTPTPTPSPTPDEREVAVTEAKQAYQNYTDAYWAMVTGGSSKSLVQKVHPYTTDRSWQNLQDEAAQLRKLELSVSGKPRPVFLRASKVNLNAERSTLRLDVCIDETDVDVRNTNGKKLNSTWIRSETTMVKENSSWKLAKRDDKIEKQSCLE